MQFSKNGRVVDPSGEVIRFTPVQRESERSKASQRESIVDVKLDASAQVEDCVSASELALRAGSLVRFASS